MFSICHISDLHIGNHDDKAWKALTRSLVDMQPDLIVISGDLSESSAQEDMERVLTWLRNQVSTHSSEPAFGLEKGFHFKDTVIITPGNHDYFYNSIVRLQKGKNTSAMNHQFFNVFDEEKYPSWRFIDRENLPGIFALTIDTTKNRSIARGHADRKDLEKIRRWCDQGRHGELENNTGKLGIKGLAKTDASCKFLKSLKIFIMHHYVTRPNSGTQPLMELDNAYELMAQLAADDFDIVLSGHDHLGYVASLNYASFLCDRSKARFARMHCTRRFGIKKSCYEVDENYRILSKTSRAALNILNRFRYNVKDTVDLLGGKDQDDAILKQLRLGYKEFIMHDLSDKKMKKIVSDIATMLQNEMRDILNNREITNAICYSSSATASSAKGFFLFSIDDNTANHPVTCTHYRYDDTRESFTASPPNDLHIAKPLDLFEGRIFEYLNEQGVTLNPGTDGACY